MGGCGPLPDSGQVLEPRKGNESKKERTLGECEGPRKLHAEAARFWASCVVGVRCGRFHSRFLPVRGVRPWFFATRRSAYIWAQVVPFLIREGRSSESAAR